MSKLNGMSDLLKSASKEMKEGIYDSQLNSLKTFASSLIRGTKISAQETALQGNKNLKHRRDCLLGAVAQWQLRLCFF